ncbi:hypothetical protein SAMN06298221_10683 [Sphaerochaeta associata]|jgi:hypothetical protein|nr:hypothetical protein SAMN06298221_10683 [Sphaerochaeta associata]
MTLTRPLVQGLFVHLGRVLTDMDILSKRYPQYFKA